MLATRASGTTDELSPGGESNFVVSPVNPVFAVVQRSIADLLISAVNNRIMARDRRAPAGPARGGAESSVAATDFGRESVAQRDSQRRVDRRRFQYRLLSLFVLTFAVALVNGLVYYLGGLYLLKQVVFILITLFLLVSVVVGPLLVIELIANLVDKIFGIPTRTEIPGRRRFD